MPLPAETISKILFASAVRTASANSTDQDVSPYLGCLVFINMTAVPGVDTVIFTLEGKDELSGTYYTILATTAIVATGLTVLRVFPGLVAAANATVNDVLPRTIRVRTTHSAASSFTYTVAVQPMTS